LLADQAPPVGTARDLVAQGEHRLRDAFARAFEVRLRARQRRIAGVRAARRARAGGRVRDVPRGAYDAVVGHGVSYCDRAPLPAPLPLKACEERARTSTLRLTSLALSCINRLRFILRLATASATPPAPRWRAATHPNAAGAPIARAKANAAATQANVYPTS